MPTQWGSFQNPFVQYAARNTARPLSSYDANAAAFLQHPDNTADAYNAVYGDLLNNPNVPLAIRQFYRQMQPQLSQQYRGEAARAGGEFTPWYEWLRNNTFENQYREMPAFQRGDKSARSFTSRFIPRF